jgi:transcriptional regulator with XRE-family HTH domain
MEPMYLSIHQKETGKRIGRLLRENGYSVRDIQKVMGFENPQAVYKWLSGKSLPSIDNFIILSRVLHTNIENILVIDGDIAILQQIFLFREADEETCLRKNPFEEEHDRISGEFVSRYGLFGEKLQTEEEKNSQHKRMYFASELPEYKEAEERYFSEEQVLDQYRNDCKDKAFQLFSHWFFALWD